MHTSHGVRHAVRSRACSHVVWVKRTPRAAAGRDGEIFLALLVAFFLICTCNRMLETRWVRGVSCDGDAYVFHVHDCHAFLHVVCAVAFYRRAKPVGVCFFINHVDFVFLVVEFRLYEGEAVDAGDDLRRVFSKAV